MSSVGKTDYTSEPINTKMLTRSQFHIDNTKTQYKIRLRQKFSNKYDKQVWNTVEEYPLREKYKGGFEETGNVIRKRNKNKELNKRYNSLNAAQKNSTQSISIRQFISEHAINEITQKFTDKAFPERNP